jgi:hypothetical protein
LDKLMKEARGENTVAAALRKSPPPILRAIAQRKRAAIIDILLIGFAVALLTFAIFTLISVALRSGN